MTTSATTSDPALPVVVIGAGPVGLAAAAHLLKRGIEPLVLEAGRSGAGSGCCDVPETLQFGEPAASAGSC